MRLAPGRELELEGRGGEATRLLPVAGVGIADAAESAAASAAAGAASLSSREAASGVDRRRGSLPLGARRGGAVGQDGRALVAGAW